METFLRGALGQINETVLSDVSPFTLMKQNPSQNQTFLYCR